MAFNLKKPHHKPLIAKITLKKIDQLPIIDLRQKYISNFSPGRVRLPSIERMSRKRSESLQSERSAYLGPSDFMQFIHQDESYNQEFCYLNNFEHPYDWRIVEYNQRNPAHFMIVSKRGVMVHKGGDVDMLTHQQFHRDKELYVRLRKIEYFSTYIKVKSFQLWRRAVKRHNARRKQGYLLKNYSILDKHKCMAIGDIKTQCYKIMTLQFKIQLGQPANANELVKQLNEWRVGEFKNDVEKSNAIILKVAHDSCKFTLEKFKLDNQIQQEGNMKQFFNQSSVIIGDSTNHRMPFTQDATLREFMNTLHKYIKLIDIMLQQSIIQLYLQGTQQIIKSLQLHNNSIKKYHSEILIIEAVIINQLVVYIPSRQETLQIFDDIIINNFNTMTETIRLCQESNEFQQFYSTQQTYELQIEEQIGLERQKLTEQIQCEINYSFDLVMNKQLNDCADALMNVLEVKLDLNDPKALLETLTKLYSEQQRVQLIDSFYDCGVLLLDTTNVRKYLESLYQDISQQYVVELLAYMNSQQQQLIAQITQLMKLLNNKPKTLNQFVTFQENFILASTEMDTLDLDLQLLQSIHKVFKVYYTSTSQLNENLFQVQLEFEVFTTKRQDINMQFPQMLEQYRIQLKKLWPLFDNKVNQFQEQLRLSEIHDYSLNNQRELSMLDTSLQNLLREQQNIKEYHIALALEPYVNTTLSDLATTYHLYQELWLTINNWHAFLTPTLREHYLDLNYLDIQERIHTSRISIKKCVHLNIPAYERIMSSLDYYSDVFEVTQYINQNQCKEIQLLVKQHWLNLKPSQQQQQQFNVLFQQCTHPLYTVQYICDIKLDEIKEQLKQLDQQFQGEQQLYIKLAELEQFWLSNRLELERVSNFRYQHKINNLQQLSTKLESNLQLVCALLSSPYIQVIQVQLDLQINQIKYFQNVVTQLSYYQEQWYYLIPIIVSPSNSKQLTRDSAIGTIFQQCDLFWKRVLRIGKDQIDLKFWQNDYIQRQIEYSLTQNIQHFPTLIASLQDILSKKRDGYPRFYFLSNNELIDLISQCKHPTSIVKYLDKVFECVRSFDYNENKDTIGHLISRQGDELPIKQIILKGGDIEDWFRLIEEAMKNSIKNTIKTCYQRMEQHELRLFSNLQNYPFQVINLVCSMLFSKQVEETIMEQNGDGLLDIMDYILSLIDDSTKHIIDQPKDRFKQIDLLLQDIYRRDMLHKLIQLNVQNINDYAWIRHLRYYMDDDVVIVKQLQHSNYYGNEYYGSNATPLLDYNIERALTALALCQQFNQYPCLVGDGSKSTLLLTYSHLLGKFHCVLNDTIDSTNFITIFKGCLITGSILIIESPDKVDDQLMHLILYTMLEISQVVKVKQTQILGDTIECNPNFMLFTMASIKPIEQYRQVYIHKPDYTTLICQIMCGLGNSNTNDLKLLLDALQQNIQPQLFNSSTFQYLQKQLYNKQTMSIQELCQLLTTFIDSAILEQYVKDIFGQSLQVETQDTRINTTVSLIEQGQVIILVTGSRNTGKSHLIKQICQQIKAMKYVYINMSAYQEQELFGIGMNPGLLYLSQNHMAHMEIDFTSISPTIQNYQVCFQNDVKIPFNNCIFETQCIGNITPQQASQFTLIHQSNEITIQTIINNQYYSLLTNDQNIKLRVSMMQYFDNLSPIYIESGTTLSLKQIVYQIKYLIQALLEQHILSDISQLAIYSIISVIQLVMSPIDFKYFMGRLSGTEIYDQFEFARITMQQGQSSQCSLQNKFIRMMNCNYYLFGGYACGKSTIVGQLSKFTIQLQYQSKSEHVLNIIYSNLISYRKDGKLVISPPAGQQYYIGVEDVNLPEGKLANPQAMFKSIEESQGLLDLSSKSLKSLEMVKFIFTSQQKIIKQYPIVKEVFVIHCVIEDIQTIYSSMVAQFVNKQQLITNDVNQIFDDILCVLLAVNQLLQPSPKCRHYHFNVISLQRLFVSLYDAHDNIKLAILGQQEIMRIFGQMLVNNEEYDQLQLEILKVIQSYRYPNTQNNEKVILADNIITYQQYVKLVEKSNPRNLYLPQESLSTILDIARAMTQEHLIVVGLVGSGKRSLISIAAQIIEYKVISNIKFIDSNTNNCLITEINGDIIQIISKHQNKQDNQVDCHIACILSSNDAMSIFTRYPRLGYMCQIIYIREWPKESFIELSKQQLKSDKFEIDVIYKTHNLISQYCPVYIKQYVDSVRLLKRSYQTKKLYLQSMLQEYSLILSKIDTATQHARTLEYSIDENKDMGSLQRLQNILTSLLIYEDNWQTQVFQLQERLLKIQSATSLEVIGQQYNMQLNRTLLYNLDPLNTLEFDNFIFNCRLKELAEQPLLIIDPSNKAMKQLILQLISPKVIEFNETALNVIQQEFPNESVIIISNVNISLLSTYKWRNLIQDIEQRQQSQVNSQFKVIFISNQSDHSAIGFIRTIKYQQNVQTTQMLIMNELLKVEGKQITQDIQQENVDSKEQQLFKLLLSTEIVGNEQIYESILKQKDPMTHQNNDDIVVLQYQPIAARINIMYNSIQTLQLLDPRYQTSLEWIMQQTTDLLRVPSKLQESERLWMLSFSINEQLTDRILHGVQPKHRLFAHFIILITSDLRNRAVTQNQYDYLLYGSVVLDKIPIEILHDNQETPPLPLEQWNKINKFAILSPLFDDIHKMFTRNIRDWQYWIENYRASMPKEALTKLPFYERLLLVRALKPQCFRQTVCNFVEERMTTKFKGKITEGMSQNKRIMIYFYEDGLQPTITKHNKIFDHSIDVGEIKQQSFIFLNISQLNESTQIQQHILYSKCSQIIYESVNNNNLLDILLMQSDKVFLNYQNNIQENVRQNSMVKSEQMKLRYQICYLHALMISRNNFIKWEVPYLFTSQNLEMLITIADNSFQRIAMIVNECVHQSTSNDQKAINALINLCSVDQVNEDSFDFIRQLAIGNQLWFNETVDQLPNYDNPTDVGIMSQYDFEVEQNNQLLQLFQSISGTPITQTQYDTKLLLEQLPQLLIPIPERMNISKKQGINLKQFDIKTQCYNNQHFILPYRKTTGRLIGRKLQDYQDPYDPYINSEITKYNVLISTIRQLLLEILNNTELDSLLSIQMNMIPNQILDYSFPTKSITFSGYLEQLNENVNMIQSYSTKPRVMDLSVLFSPQLFLNTLVIQFARKFRFNYSELGLYTDMSTILQSQTNGQKLNEGTTYISGIVNDNCRWNQDKFKISDNELHQTKPPLILVTVAEGQQQFNLSIPLMFKDTRLLNVEVQSDISQVRLDLMGARLLIQK